VDRVVVVAVQPSTQVGRLIAGSVLTEVEARTRVAAQMPVEERLKHADHRIDGERSLPEVREQAREIWLDLCREAGTALAD